MNVLALIYANVYFHYSNSLKDIGFYLGQRWTEDNATGLQSRLETYLGDDTRSNIQREDFASSTIRKIVMF